MLYWLLYQKLFPYFRLFRIFRYLTFRTVFASLTALLIGLLIGPYVIERLREFQIGQYIREEGPQSHQKKSGTPTMGGVLICISILVPTLLWADLSNPLVWMVMLSTLAFGAIGFADDYIKVVHKRNQGLTARAEAGAAVCGERGSGGGAGAAAVAGDVFDAADGAVCEAVPAGPGVGVAGAYSAYALAGVSAVCGVRDAGDCGFQQCGEPDGRAGRAGDRLHDYCGRRADGADVCERARGVFGLSGVGADADGERADDLLRVDGGGEYRVPLVQRASGGGVYGRCGVAGAGWGDWDGGGDHQAGAAAAVYWRRVYAGGC